MGRSLSPKTQKRKSSVKNVQNKRRKISKEKCQERPKKGVIKSPRDPSKYKLIVLSNGVKAILISSLESSEESESDLEVDERTGELKKVMHFNKRHINFDADNSSKNTSTNYKDKLSFHKSKDFRRKTKGVQRMCAKISSTEFGGLISVSVAAGCTDDPKDLPGLAHLTEHCILLETKQSGKGVYDPLFNYLEMNGGYGNAFTSLDRTTFVLEAPLTNGNGKCVFEEGIELLVNSIVDPLLRKETIVREINAVDCEYQIATSSYPYWSMLLSLAKSNHPLNRFPCGNQKTLDTPCIDERLREWKEKHYVGSSISLAIDAPLKMNELERIIVNNFSRIPRSSGNPASTRKIFEKNDEPFDTPEFQKVYSIATSRYYNSLNVTWSVPANTSQDFEVNPLTYISYMLSWQNKGSLAHYLKTKGWIFYLSVHDEDFGYCGIIKIYITLTETGLDNYENVVESIFSYLNFMKLRKTDVGIVNDLQQLYLDKFHYRSFNWSLSNVINLDHAIQKRRGIYAITAHSLITKCVPKFVDSVVERLTPRKANFMLMSRRFMGNPNLYEEKWMGVKYFSNDLSDQKIQDWANVRPYREFQLRPQNNNHLTRDLHCPKDAPTRTGWRLIADDNRAYVVHFSEPCEPGNLPKAECQITILSNSAPTTLNLILLNLWMLLINSEIESEFNDSLPCLRMTASSSIIWILANSHPADILDIVVRALEKFNKFEVGLKEETYKLFWNILFNRLQNVMNSEDYFLGDLTRFILDENHERMERVFDTLKDSGFEDFLDFIRGFKAQMKIYCRITGHVANDQADRISELIIGMPYREIPGRCLPREKRCMQIPLGQKCLRVFAFKPDESMILIRNYYQIGFASPSQTSKFFQISEILNVSCFNQLRTVEQLTYVVHAYANSYADVLGICVELLLQAQKHKAETIDKRIDEHLKTFYETEFSSENLTQLLKNNPGQANIDENYVEQMRTLFADHLLPSGKGYRKLSIQISPNPRARSQEGEPELSLHYDLPPALVSSDSDYYIRNLDLFKSHLYSYPEYPVT